MKKNEILGIHEGDMLLPERIWRSLADEIAAGLIPPGTSLDEQQLADRFGTSRTPVREAVRRLAAEKLVEVRPRRGAVVIEISIERLFEMLEMSAELEALCVRMATNRMTPIERAQLQHIHNQSLAFVEVGDSEGYSTAYQTFHIAMAKATHNAYIAEQMHSHRTRTKMFRRVPMFETYTIKQSYDAHTSIMEAINHGDGEEAARRMRSHVYAIASSLKA